jgi:hypothetical protein
VRSANPIFQPASGDGMIGGHEHAQGSHPLAVATIG